MSFEKSLSIADDLAVEVNKEARAIGINLLNGLTRVTPVDTGRARGNWYVGIVSPNRDIETMRRALTAITDGLTVFSAFKKTPSFYNDLVLSNNLPYIERLNDGYSAQAPKKFVEIEIDRVVNASRAR